MDSAATLPEANPLRSSNVAPEAVDLSHHLSQLSRERMTSPLKSLYKYMSQPGMTMLAGGLPSPEYFPFESISAQVLVPNSFKTTESSFSWLWGIFGKGGPKTRGIEIPKYVDNPGPMSVQLSTALQYGTATGLPALQSFTRDFVTRVFTPAYANYEVILNAGSTDAWSKICTTLLERGDGILCEEWTYPSALAAAWPSGFKPVPLKMDGEGMTPAALEEVLGSWDPAARGGMSRPRVLYTVPVCQNPTGATMSAERKKAIYALCVKYDVIIVEDDPYYFLQAGEYEAPDSRARKNAETDDEFLASLVPSYLKFDYQGRVIRIDTFSKTICPGSRLGFLTLNPLFAERMLRANESSTQAPCGFGQALVTKLLVEEWGMTGYLRWLKGLKAQYRQRRDMLVDCLLDQGHAGLDARSSSSGVFELRTRARDEKGFSMSEKSADKTLLSFVAPQGGMFVWLRVHVSEHRDYGRKLTSELVMALWEEIAEAKVLIAPGTMFSGRTFGDETAQEELVQEDGDGFFRLAFSTASEEEMKHAMTVVAKVVRKFFE